MVKKIKFFGGFETKVDFEDSAFGRLESILRGGGKVGIACSGGADSVFLLHCAVSCFPEFLDNVCVLHFNHKVREAAELDEKFVREICGNLNLNLLVDAPQSKPLKVSEDSLRALRLDFFAKEFRELGLSAILQGHHCGDVAESLLMRLARGSGIDGLCAPRPVSEWRGAEFLRPLLNVKKSEIVSALIAAKIPWREDESNAGADFFRNRIRNIVLPEFCESSPSDLYRSIGRSRKLLQEDATALDSIFEAEFSSANREWTKGEKIYLTPLMLAHASLVRRAVVRIFSANSLEMRPCGVDALTDKILRRSNAKASIGGFFAFFDPADNSLNIAKNTSCPEFEIRLKIGKNILPDGSAITVRRVSLTNARREAIKKGENDDSVSAYIDLAAVGNAEDGCVTARSRRAGDVYAPLGRRTAKKIKDMFNAKKVPCAKRNALPVVCNKKGEILWVPFLAPSNKYKITNAGAALELTFDVS